MADGDAFTAAGQVRIVVDPSNLNNRIVELNTDLDDAVEASILLKGLVTFLDSSDFDP